jgi:hypothetical protein
VRRSKAWAPKCCELIGEGSGLGRASGGGQAGIRAKAKAGVFGRFARVTMPCTPAWSAPAGRTSTSQTPIEPPWRRRRVRTSSSPAGRAAA